MFVGTRVPVRILMEHLEAGDRLEDFLTYYPSVSRNQTVALLERAGYKHEPPELHNLHFDGAGREVRQDVERPPRTDAQPMTTEGANG